jgi:hypothetical protein
MAPGPVIRHLRWPTLSGVLLLAACVTAPVPPGEPADPVPVRDWPGDPVIQPADAGGVFQENLSGLAYQASGSSAPGVLWAARNGPGSVFRLVRDGSIWTPDPRDDWGEGKRVRYPDGTGEPDAEGITFTGSGDGLALYVASERNNQVRDVSRNSVLRFDPGAPGATLVATHEWNLTGDIPRTGANSGIEAITFVPDAFLVSSGFRDEGVGGAYDPARYPDHGGGLFFVGVEATGMIYGYALNHRDGSFARIATISSGLPAVMALEFDPGSSRMWAVCDNGCDGRAALLSIDARPGSATTGRFTPVAFHERPAGMPNVNNEGFAVAPLEECAAGTRPAFWSDDDETDGHSLRRGALACP